MNQFPSWHRPPPTVHDSTLIPSGLYAAVIVTSEERQPPGKPRYYCITFMILDGPHAGKRIEDHLLINDPNQSVQDESFMRLSCICHATGVLQINSSSRELHGIPLGIEVLTVGRTSVITGHLPRPSLMIEKTTVVHKTRTVVN